MSIVGYGRIEPKTTSGRLFCVIFGVVGTPIVMITLANFGKYLHDLVPKMRDRLKKMATERVQRRNSAANVGVGKKEVSETEYQSNCNIRW